MAKEFIGQKLSIPGFDPTFQPNALLDDADRIAQQGSHILALGDALNHVIGILENISYEADGPLTIDASANSLEFTVDDIASGLSIRGDRALFKGPFLRYYIKADPNAPWLIQDSDVPFDVANEDDLNKLFLTWDYTRSAVPTP